MKLKNVLILVLVLSVSTLAQSPIGKGSISLGGSVTYSNQSFENTATTYTTFMFNPKAGYFFFDNIYSALSVSYTHYNYGGGAISDIYGFGPIVRYYFDVDNIKPFLGFGYNYMYQTNTGETSNYITNEFKISAGMDFFVTKALALESSINYGFRNFKMSETRAASQKSKVFSLELGFNYFIF